MITKSKKKLNGSEDEAENDDDYTPNHSRSRSRSSAAAKQARTSSQISQEQNNVAAFPQPPKERPDAKNHLKVTIEKGNFVAMSYLIISTSSLPMVSMRGDIGWWAKTLS